MLTGSLAGSILAFHPRGERMPSWRAHGPWCRGPSTLALTREALIGKELDWVDNFLTCILRFCPLRVPLITLVERDPSLLWRSIELADALPRSEQPVGVRAMLEAGDREVWRRRADVVPVATEVWDVDRKGQRTRLPDLPGYRARREVPMGK